MSVNLVEMKQVSFTHENGKAVFEHIDIAIPREKVTVILGPSGTGKTTLLRLMSGQMKPCAGTIKVEGEIIHHLTRKKLFEVRKRMGMLFQAGGLFTHLSVYENVAFALREHTSLSPSMIHSLVLLKLQLVGLRGAAHLMPGELSGGMSRRVALARAIALDPQLILYDEPFTGQDPISMGVLVKLIRSLNEVMRMTSVIVTHDVQEALSIADYVYVIANKVVIGQGTPEEILNHQSPQVHQFVQGLPDGPVPFHYPAMPLEKDFLEGSIASC